MATFVPPNADTTQAKPRKWITVTTSCWGKCRQVWVCVRSAVVTVEQLLLSQIALSRAVGNTVEHGNCTAIPLAGVLYGCPRNITLGERWQVPKLRIIRPSAWNSFGRDRYSMVRSRGFCATLHASLVLRPRAFPTGHQQGWASSRRSNNTSTSAGLSFRKMEIPYCLYCKGLSASFKCRRTVCHGGRDAPERVPETWRMTSGFAPRSDNPKFTL